MELDLRGELFIGGTWVDATGNMLKRQALVHSRGRQDQGARVDPSTCAPLLNNTDGRFSPDNPAGPYYGQFGRNTPFRVSVRAGTPALELDGNGANNAATPSHTSLNITGDLDLRWEGEADWYAPGFQTLMGKWGGPGNRSYTLRLESGSLYILGARNGTTGTFGRWPLPALPRRAAVRGTMDVDNGAGGVTIRLYWAPSLDGPWVQFSDDIVVPETLSVFVGTAPLTIAPEQLDEGSVRPAVAGRVYRAEVRNGINGPIVAAPNFGAQAAGTTSFTDSAGRLWTLTGTARITDRRTRLVHELAAYPTRWHPSGAHAWVDAQTAGILRRLGRSTSALDSTLRRRIPSYRPLAYWPLEDGPRATQGYSPIPGVAPLDFTEVDWGSADSLPSSNALPVLNSTSGNNARMLGVVPGGSGPSLPAWSVHWIYRLDQINDTHYTFMRILSTGTVREWYVQTRNSQTRIIGKNGSGAEVFNQLIGTENDLYGQWVMVRFRVVQEGGTVRWRISWMDVGGDAGGFTGTFPGTSGRPVGVASPPDGYAQALNGMAIGHISVFDVEYTFAYDGAIDAWTGETAGARMRRLAQEESLPVSVYGPPREQERVGPQSPAPVLALLEEAADADGGILYEDRERPALTYRTRASMYSQRPALTLDYTQPGLAAPLEPTGDDDGTENDVTISRTGGSSGRAVLEQGALSVQAPPNGVGAYPVQETLNLHSDDQTEPIAYWRLRLGTYEGRRYPQVRVMVHKAPPELLDQILAVDVGDRLVIKNPPIWVAPGDIELIVQGYEETFEGPFQWDIVFNCKPGEPWLVAVADGPSHSRADTDGSRLAEDLTTAETGVDVFTTAGPPWSTDPAVYPALVRAGGETMTVTACTSSRKDSFARTLVDSWGAATVGGTWTTAGGAAGNYDVTGGQGVHTLSTVGVSRRSLLPAPAADFDIYVDMTSSVAATGASLTGAIMARYVDIDNMYMARLEFTTAGAIVLGIRRWLANSESVLGSYTTGLTHTPGTYMRLRFQGAGSTLRAKAWRVGTAEPATWQVQVTDSTLPGAGSVGLRSISATGNTNTNAEIRYRNFDQISPQTLTVVRSVNGVVKAHPAGASLALAQPAIAAL
ncbi:hypothetical protein ACH4C6_21600 [Streptomyces sp. NPDC017943]|uniref:hypothetical protein n=1 Tax=Streptomyces sp. NPDC017943 TaxID=3365019 RepID=UPI0037A865C4